MWVAKAGLVGAIGGVSRAGSLPFASGLASGARTAPRAFWRTPAAAGAAAPSGEEE